MNPHYALFETTAGFCGLAWTNDGVVRFQLPGQSRDETERLLKRREPDMQPGTQTPEIASTIEAVKRYFEGETVDFGHVPVDLSGQDDFFKAIYGALRQVGWGQTTTYGALAKQLGAGSEAARDVGVAMGRNPVALIIPCHRCLAAGGKLGGFSAPGGSDTKLKMLELEGVNLRFEPKQFNLF
ncbi:MULTISPECIES: methylated-DNA--[protein]-cysteine S-methyltransferase [Asticcacaulis]|uniref:methylated-DNA--[protein]-cysteine S-methyltransferase n=1 Tax=Asticcacaulis TaxID=76890 RepID=UPI001AE146BE|nr:MULTISPECIES: methylated-DNA--[protein]-cysteine S-methyltransferase [Asticcacaulis]MBP2158884.1 methylated-DNA-[protein]-cysteine S-methyltransferase [Asticcacaulis solisilvae]MDR6799929.1 methylated-DNA-[protein]-cysteine S-methyltransferase [Asticcacaulis sp. BE141]